jgi:predicted acyl esterase
MWSQLADMFHLASLKLKADYIKTLPTIEFAKELSEGAPYLYDFMQKSSKEEFWSEKMFIEKNIDQIDVPIFHVGSWYDYFVTTTIGLYEILSKNTNKLQKLWMGPWGIIESSFMDFFVIDFCLCFC